MQNIVHIIRGPRKCEAARYFIQDGEDTRHDTGAVECKEDYRFHHTSRYLRLAYPKNRPRHANRHKIRENRFSSPFACQASSCQTWLSQLACSHQASGYAAWPRFSNEEMHGLNDTIDGGNPRLANRQSVPQCRHQLLQCQQVYAAFYLDYYKILLSCRQCIMRRSPWSQLYRVPDEEPLTQCENDRWPSCPLRRSS